MKEEELHASPWLMSYAFVVSMGAWNIIVRPAGRFADGLADAHGLIAPWLTMTLRLTLVTVATES